MIPKNDGNSKLPSQYTNGTFSEHKIGKHPMDSSKDASLARQSGTPSTNRANDDLGRRMQIVSKRAALTGKRKVGFT